MIAILVAPEAMCQPIRLRGIGDIPTLILAAEFSDQEVEAMVEVEARKLTVVRVALAGAVAAMAFYFLCWPGGFVPIGPTTHLYLQLFTADQQATANRKFLLEGNVGPCAQFDGE
jgi:hypothetical protein